MIVGCWSVRAVTKYLVILSLLHKELGRIWKHAMAHSRSLVIVVPTRLTFSSGESRNVT